MTCRRRRSSTEPRSNDPGEDTTLLETPGAKPITGTQCKPPPRQAVATAQADNPAPAPAGSSKRLLHANDGDEVTADDQTQVPKRGRKDGARASTSDAASASTTKAKASAKAKSRGKQVSDEEKEGKAKKQAEKVEKEPKKQAEKAKPSKQEKETLKYLKECEKTAGAPPDKKHKQTTGTEGQSEALNGQSEQPKIRNFFPPK